MTGCWWTPSTDRWVTKRFRECSPAFTLGGAISMVRVGGYDDRPGIQQALDMGADGVLVPYINTADEARQAVSCCRYPTAGTRSVYFPQRSMNAKGLLGYAGAWNDNVICALQVETADCIKNIDEIAAVPGVDILFLGQNDLCMSMGLYREVQVPGYVHFSRTERRHPEADQLPQRRITSFSACSCSAPPASASSWRKASPSERRQRPASHADAGRRLRERHRESCRRKRASRLGRAVRQRCSRNTGSDVQITQTATRRHLGHLRRLIPRFTREQSACQ